MKINLFQPSAPDNRRAKMAFSNTKWLLFLFQFLTVFLVYTFQIKKLSERSLLFGAGLLVVSLLSLTLLRFFSSCTSSCVAPIRFGKGTCSSITG